MVHIIVLSTGNHKRPTKNVEEIGIFMQEKQGQYGTYLAVLYTESAQKFIIDNLASIIAGGYNTSKRE